MTAVSDDFNRANGALGANWTSVTSGLVISSNTAQSSGGDNFAQAIYSATAIGNGSEAIEVAADYANAGNNFKYPGVLLSESNANTNNCYRASFGPSTDQTMYITRVLGGSSTDIASTSFNGGTSGRIRLVWDPADDSITVYVNDVEILSTTDSNVAPQYGGIHCYQNSTTVNFDNFAGDTVGGGAVDLVVADLAVATTVESVTLTQVHELAVADLAVATTIDAPTLTVDAIDLVVADLAVATTIDEVTITVAPVDLIVAPLDVATTIDTLALTQTHELAVADLDVAVTIDGVTITVDAIDLVVAPLNVATTIDEIALTQVHELIVAPLDVAVTIDTIALTGEGDLDVADLTVAVTIDTIALTQVHELEVDDLTVDTTIDTVAITQTHELAVADLAVATTIDEVTLTVGGVDLTVAPLDVAVTIDTPTLTQVHELVVADLTVGTSIDTITLGIPGEGGVFLGADLITSITLGTEPIVTVHQGATLIWEAS